ncbi:Protein of unknown function [Leuconostoc citreum LBAE C11]|nr:Protein of unknown function [Leuconostoc citreum LBAE C11]
MADKNIFEKLFLEAEKTNLQVSRKKRA